MKIVHETIARVSPDKIYEVLTDPVHLAAWYAPNTQADPTVGSIAEFRFDRGTIRVEITELEPNVKVGWKVLQGMPGWEGITGDILWELKPSPYGNGTMINYTHTGWTAMDGPYPSVSFRSAWYMARMQTYAETGVASPVPTPVH